MIKYFLTVFKDGDHDGKNLICKSKEDAIAQAQHTIKDVLHKDDTVMLCYGDFDEKENHLKSGSFYYLDSWKVEK